MSSAKTKKLSGKAHSVGRASWAFHGDIPFEEVGLVSETYCDSRGWRGGKFAELLQCYYKEITEQNVDLVYLCYSLLRSHGGSGFDMRGGGGVGRWGPKMGR